VGFLGPLLSVATKERCLEEEKRKATQFFIFTNHKQWFVSDGCLGAGGVSQARRHGREECFGGTASAPPSMLPSRTGLPHQPWLIWPWETSSLSSCLTAIPTPRWPLLTHHCLPGGPSPAPSPSLRKPGARGGRAAHSCRASPALCFPW